MSIQEGFCFLGRETMDYHIERTQVTRGIGYL